jgi:tetratricopeptide (TPR) repeat protein
VTFLAKIAFTLILVGIPFPQAAKGYALIDCVAEPDTSSAAALFGYWVDRYGSELIDKKDPFSEDESEPTDVDGRLKLFQFYDNYYTTHRTVRIRERKDRVAKNVEVQLSAKLESDPCSFSTREKLIYFYVLESDWISLGRTSRDLVQHYPDHFKGYMALGLAMYQLNEFDEAESLFRSGIARIQQDHLAEFLSLEALYPELSDAEYESQPLETIEKVLAPLNPRYLSEHNERFLGHVARIVYADIAFSIWRNTNSDEWLISPGDFIIRYGIPRAKSVRTFEEPSYERRTTLVFERHTWTFIDHYRNDELFMTGRRLMMARDTIAVTPQTYSLPGLRFQFSPPVRSYCFASQSGTSGSADLFVTYGVPVKNDSAYLENAILETGVFLEDSLGTISGRDRTRFYGLAENGIVRRHEYPYWFNTRRLLIEETNLSFVTVEIESAQERVFGRAKQPMQNCIGSNGPRMSDLVLADLVEVDAAGGITGRSFVRQGHRIWPALVQEFTSNDPVYLFAEIYDLTESDILVEASIVPKKDGFGVLGRLFGSGRDESGVSVQVPLRITSHAEPIYQIIDVAELEPGSYVLGYAIRDAESGEILDYKTSQLSVK